MSKRIIVIVAICVAFAGGFFLNNRLGIVQGQMKAGAGFAAVPGMKGGQDTFGPYDPVPNWRKSLSAAYPDLAGWTYSQATDVWAEDNRVIVTQKGLLPEIKEGRGGVAETWLPQIGPGLKFPVGGGVPLRETASASPSFGDVPRPAENKNCP
jgi:hypothetical protein